MTASTDKPSPTLPHRAPFLLLDAVVDVVPGERARAEKLVSADDPLMRDDVTLGAVLLLEAMAQCAGIAAGSSGDERSGALVAVDRFQVHGFVEPGDRLTLEARVAKIMGTMVMVRTTAHVSGELRAEGQLILRLGALPE